MLKKIKIIIAGYGVVGKKRHEVLNKLDNVNVIAICDRSFKQKIILIIIIILLMH